MIKRVRVKNLSERFNFDLPFHPDVNIITGRNGSGKTTLLKLIWYMLSGNIELALSELSLDAAFIETDSYTLEIERIEKQDRPVYRLKTSLMEHPIDITTLRAEMRASKFEVIRRRLAEESGRSVFFPTFRRIEGGFSIGEEDDEQFTHRPARMRTGRLQQAMSELSERMSSQNHQFVSSISTNDVGQLLTQQYALVLQQTNRMQTELAQFILASMSRRTDRTPTEANDLLHEIEERASVVTQRQEALLRPFNALNDLVVRVFQHKGIVVNRTPITLGDSVGAISSESLSAGEKQMLSFLSYNAFSKKSCIFIDEPEISLHVDWQRVLFPTLLAQASDNQFIVATHSPFIYSKYADKELMLSEDRGER